MKIQDAYTIVTCPGRNFVTLKIVTESGTYGIGDATLNGREMAVTAYLDEHVVPTLIGRDASRIEDTWQYLYRGAYWRRGPVTMTAIAAVDMALWDIKAKAAGMPLYQLLGGKSRERVMTYAHCTGQEIDDCLEEVARHVEMAIAQCASRPACQGSRPPTAWPRTPASATSRPTPHCLPNTSGAPKSTLTMRPSCSPQYASASATSCTSCTTSTTG